MTLGGFLVAFGGGVLGTAVGGLIAFSLVGVFGLIGIAILAGGGTAPWNAFLTFGPAWAPAMGGFAAGVAGAAFAATKGKLKKGNDIVTPVYSTGSGEAHLVGGIFGIVGYVLVWLLGKLGISPWTDGVALVVFISAVIVRLVWGKTGLFGKVPAGQDRFAAVKSNPMLKIALGAGVGLFSAGLYNALGADNGGVIAGFCISATTLIFLQAGFGVPVTHQITLPAAVAASLVGAGTTSMIWGAVFGILGAFGIDFFAGLINAFGDTHIDPPACTIAVLTTLAIVLSKIGIL